MIKIEINDKDKSKLIWLLNKGMEITKSDTKFNFYEQLLDKVLLSENKQGVSDSPTENGALPLVRQSNASDKTDKSTSESEHGTLEKITDDESVIKCADCNEPIRHTHFKDKGTEVFEIICGCSFNDTKSL